MARKTQNPNVDGIENLETAPMLFFDETPLCGASKGIARMTLTVRYDTYENGDKPTSRRRTVAHIQFPMETIGLMRRMLDAIEELASRRTGSVN